MAYRELCLAQKLALWRKSATLALGIGVASLTFAPGPVWGNRTDPPPRALHVPYEEVTFTDPSLRIQYDQRCAADLQIMTRFFRSAAAAEQWLDGRANSNRSGKKERAGRELVRSAVLDHRDARDALFKCLSFLAVVQQSASEANLNAADTAIKLHQATLTSIDGRIIQMLIRLERFEF